MIPLRGGRAVRESGRSASTPLYTPWAGDFGPGVALVRDWPARVAVIVGEAVAPTTVDVVTQLGFQPVTTAVEDVATTLAAAGPFTFLVLGVDALDSDEAIARIRDWHATSPSARVKLVHEGPVERPEVLVRAIRAGVTDVVDLTAHGALHLSLRSGMTRAGAMRERVLAIGAHPDDVEIGCGGTLLDHRRRGDRVSILTLSRGAVGGDQRQRLDEATATADAIGAQLLFGDLPDTEIDDGIDTIRMIERVVRTVDPTVVYVHSRHDNHQDHRAVSTATTSATRGVRRVFAYQSPSATNDFLPTQFVNVDATVHRKVEVLELFASQDGRSYLEPELVTASARYWARHLAANARYAEPFEVIRSVGELRHSVSAPVGMAVVPVEVP
ncbi:PIG-L deacetylase family protein [Jatrophihabitans endophyticus]|uniref:PIG-L deacetylase family protein n=1 Tax=Jatrophihabitans endophyticus TaxID=1206085 RepID=UPI00190EE83A|nr:PIG-L family deacetylase [Jatrophihabitans endophyticus]